MNSILHIGGKNIFDEHDLSQIPKESTIKELEVSLSQLNSELKGIIEKRDAIIDKIYSKYNSAFAAHKKNLKILCEWSIVLQTANLIGTKKKLDEIAERVTSTYQSTIDNHKKEIKSLEGRLMELRIK